MKSNGKLIIKFDKASLENWPFVLHHIKFDIERKKFEEMTPDESLCYSRDRLLPYVEVLIEKGQVLGAYLTGKMIGFISYEIIKNLKGSWVNAKHGYVNNHFRRKGIGTALLVNLIYDARMAGADFVEADFTRDSVAYFSCRELGFQQSGDIRRLRLRL